LRRASRRCGPPRTPLASRPIADVELVRAGAALMDQLEIYPMPLRMQAPGECPLQRWIA
jgi:hypothetical protein